MKQGYLVIAQNSKDAEGKFCGQACHDAYIKELEKENKLEKDHPIASTRCGSTALCGIHYLNKVQSLNNSEYQV